MGGQINALPVIWCFRTPYKLIGAGIIGNKLGRTHFCKIGKSRIRKLYPQIQPANPIHYLILAIGRGTWQERAGKLEHKFGFCNRHPVAAKGHNIIFGKHHCFCQPACYWPVNADMLLACYASSCNFPAYSGVICFDNGLNLITLFTALRPACFR